MPRVHVTPYVLRHCSAAGALPAGVSAFVMNEITGYGHAETTTRYPGLVPEDLSREMKKARLLHLEKSRRRDK